MTTRPARRSLAKAFQPVTPAHDRAESLTGLLPPRPGEDQSPGPVPAPATTRGPESSPELVPDSPAAREPGVLRRPSGTIRPSRRSRPQRDDPPELDLDLVRNVAVYLPLGLLDRIRRTARSRELTYAELVVEASAAHLSEVAARFGPDREESGGVGMPARRTRQRAEPGVQAQIRLDGHQVAWLDRQVEHLGAPSRSALVAALLDIHLGGTRVQRTGSAD